MREKILVLGCLLSTAILAQEINFESLAWADIRAKAKQENKLIFLDAYTAWCGPCKYMAKNVFTKKEVGDFYNSNFINAKMDMEKGEGPAIAKLYNVGCYPNLLFIDGDGKLVHRSAGGKEVTTFIELGKAAKTDKTFSVLEAKYNAGSNSPAFISEYLEALASSCLSPDKVAFQYFDGLKTEDMILKDNWEIFRNFVSDIHSKPFTYFLDNRKLFAEKHTQAEVDKKIFNSYLYKSNQFIYSGKVPDDNAIANLKNEIDNLAFERAEELKLSIDEPYYSQKKDWNNYFETTNILVKKFKQKDSEFLNNTSYTIFENSNNKAHLAEAENWAKRSVEIEEGWANLDTYACLLNKNGKNKEAIETQKKAIAIGKAHGEDTSGLEKTLKGFENKKG